MKRRTLLFLSLLAFTAPQFISQAQQPAGVPAAAQPAGFGTVQGTVVREGTSDPIPDVQITVTGRGGMTAQEAQSILAIVARGAAGGFPPELLQTAQDAARGNQTPLTAVSDSNGQFSIRNVPAGQQTLRAQLEGYFGRPVSGNYSPIATAPVAVNANQTANVRFSMLPGGTITGRVFDQAGKPLSESTVQVLRSGYQNGSPLLQIMDLKTTDDRGEYRLYRLPPGEYYLAATPKITGLPTRGAGNGGREIPVATYYPNTADPATAQPLNVRSGDEMSGVNIQLRTGLSVKVSGRVSSAFTTGPLIGRGGQVRPSAAGVMLVPRTSRGLLDVTGGGAVTANQETGAFEILNVLPGAYDLIARLPIDSYNGWGPQNPPALATGSWAFGRTAIDVIAADLENVSIVVRKGLDLKGRVILDGKPSAANLRVSVQPESTDDLNDQQTSLVFNQIRQYQAATAEDGSFTIPLLPEGRYRFQILFNSTGARGRGGRGQAAAEPAPATPPLPALPASTYVADIRQGGMSVYDNGLTVGGDSVNSVDVIVNTTGGSLEGTISNFKKDSTPAMVILVPAENRRQNPLLYKTTGSDSQGKFTFTVLPPGRYTLFAWESVPAGAYQNAEFLSRYAGRGTAVLIEAGARSTATVSVIPDDSSQR